MTISLPAILLLLAIAAVCAVIGKVITGSSPGVVIVSAAVGFVGALFFPWIAHQLHLAEPLMVSIGGYPFSAFWSIIGAACLVAIVQ